MRTTQPEAKQNYSEVSAFEAKTHLSELLRETEAGHSFIIRRRGKIVARLVPPEPVQSPPNLDQILASLRVIRHGIKGKLRVRELIEEGHRH